MRQFLLCQSTVCCVLVVFSGSAVFKYFDELGFTSPLFSCPFFCSINLSTMEFSQSDAGTSGSQEVHQKLQMSGKPLHRFIKGEPKSLGVILKLWTVEVLRNMLEHREGYRLGTRRVLTCVFFSVAFSRLLFYFLAVQSSWWDFC